MAEDGIKQISVIKDAVLGFVNTMSGEKRSIEQQIKERVEGIKGQFLSSGATQFTFAQINELSEQYKESFLSFYQNSIHMKILASASSHLRHALEYGFTNAGLVQQELIDAINNLQGEIDESATMSDQLDNYERTIEEQATIVSDLTEGQKLTRTDMEQIEDILKEKDQTIKEKDQEILNLSEGLARMESQVNTMGANMLQNSMAMEDLQSALVDKDNEIAALEERVKAVSDMAPAETSSELVEQLQDNLDKTRTELLQIRKDLVTKNDELYEMKVQFDEADTKLTRQNDRLTSMKDNYERIQETNEQQNKELSDIEGRRAETANKFAELTVRFDNLTKDKNTLEEEMTEARTKLAGYEGKQTITAEEQQKFVQEITDLNKRLKQTSEVIDYVKTIVSSDIKFKLLFFLESIDEEVRIDDLATAVGMPQEVVHKIVIELTEADQASARREGRYLFVSKGLQINPVALKAISIES